MPITISRALADSGLAPVDARALLRHQLATDDAHLITHASQILSHAEEKNYKALVARRSAGEPVAHITGIREFFSLEFRVTPAVLIPRPETELLVEVALDHIAAGESCRVLDLGTGSGCIAISIAKHRPRAQVMAIDSSSVALDVARANTARLLGDLSATPSPLTGEGRDAGRRISACYCAPSRSHPVNGSLLRAPAHLPRQGGGDLNLRFVQSDWFSAFTGQRFDLIVSNPPYIATGDPHLGQGDLRFEPPAALVAGNDGLDCIRLILASAPQYLEPGGWLMFEHGYDQAERCRKLLTHAGFRGVFSRTDFAGIERVSAGRWNGQA